MTARSRQADRDREPGLRQPVSGPHAHRSPLSTNAPGRRDAADSVALEAGQGSRSRAATTSAHAPVGNVPPRPTARIVGGWNPGTRRHERRRPRAAQAPFCPGRATGWGCGRAEAQGITSWGPGEFLGDRCGRRAGWPREVLVLVHGIAGGAATWESWPNWTDEASRGGSSHPTCSATASPRGTGRLLPGRLGQRDPRPARRSGRGEPSLGHPHAVMMIRLRTQRRPKAGRRRSTCRCSSPAWSCCQWPRSATRYALACRSSLCSQRVWADRTRSPTTDPDLDQGA
jgi:hypothetical protein